MSKSSRPRAGGGSASGSRSASDSAPATSSAAGGPGDLAGKLAPDFTATTDADEPLRLSSLRGRVVVLFFYPKDDTPGCTVEACSFRDALPRFEGIDAVVLGVSPDSPKSHRKFKKKFELPYTLLADENHAVAEQYHVWGPKTMFGLTFDGVARTTFVIDRDGRVAHVFEKVKPEGHAEAVAEVVHTLG